MLNESLPFERLNLSLLFIRSGNDQRPPSRLRIEMQMVRRGIVADRITVSLLVGIVVQSWLTILRDRCKPAAFTKL